MGPDPVSQPALNSPETAIASEGSRDLDALCRQRSQLLIIFFLFLRSNSKGQIVPSQNIAAVENMV